MNTPSLPHPDTREHILEVGEAIILGKGFAAVGLAEILGSAQVPKGSFYHYFRSKEQFGTALLERYFDRYLADLNGLLATPQAATGLVNYWESWRCHQGGCRAEEQCLVVKLSAEVSDLSVAMREALDQGTQRIMGRLAAALAAGQQDGSLPPNLDPAATALELYALWLGASLLTKLRRDASALDQAMVLTRARLGLTPAQD